VSASNNSTENPVKVGALRCIQSRRKSRELIDARRASLSFLGQRIREISLRVTMNSAFRSREAQSACGPLPKAVFTYYYI
jgi:hypothetical protein